MAKRRKVKRGKGRKRAAAKDTQTFPQQIFVTHQGEGDDAYLSASDSYDDAHDGDAIALYEFVGVRTKRITHALED